MHRRVRELVEQRLFVAVLVVELFAFGHRDAVEPGGVAGAVRRDVADLDVGVGGDLAHDVAAVPGGRVELGRAVESFEALGLLQVEDVVDGAEGCPGRSVCGGRFIFGCRYVCPCRHRASTGWTCPGLIQNRSSPVWQMGEGPQCSRSRRRSLMPCRRHASIQSSTVPMICFP